MHITWSVIGRSAVLVLFMLASGCGSDTVLRLTVRNGQMMPAPASLRVALVGAGVSAAPRVIAPVSLPGVVVIRALPSAATQLCVDLAALDAGGAPVGQAAVTVQLAAHGTTSADVTLAPPGLGAGCAASPGDGGGDLAGDSGDLALPPPPSDLAGVDIAPVLCPPGTLFCDDFESGNINKWTTTGGRFDLSSLDVQQLVVRHGSWALHAAASGTPTQNNLSVVEYDFPPGIAPPLAIRANLYFARQLDSYTTVMALYDSTVHGFAVGGDNVAGGTWVLTEDQAGAPDHHTDMVPATGGQWYCVELVVDAAGMVSLYVDGNQLVAPFQRLSPVAYSAFIVGVERTVLADTNVFVDDAAMARTRLYCPWRVC